MIRGTGNIIALYGHDARKVRAEVLDLQHGRQFVPTATVEGSGRSGPLAGNDQSLMPEVP
jgi:L-lactate dehydrogenase